MATSGLTWLSFFLRRDGYGYAAACTGRALRALSPENTVVEMENGSEELDWRADGPAAAMALPDWWKFIHGRPFVGFTMHEATRLAPGWAEEINSSGAAAVLVPCEWNRQVFEESGVTLPIRVARFGIDPAHYWPVERHRDDNAPYTFLWSGNGGADWRKGWDVAYGAFRKAFGDRKDVRLILHFRQPLAGNATFADANVETVTGYLDLPAWRGMLEAADVFVFPSRGEGWGLPPREAAATGLPALVTDWGGLAEEIGYWAISIEVKRLAPAQFGFYEAGDIGDWAEPDVDHLVFLMRSCEMCREVVAGIGADAAVFLRGTTWERTAQAIMKTVEEVGNGK